MTYFRTENDGGVLTVWLDMPGEKVNKLTAAMLSEFNDLLNTIESDPEVKAAVLISAKEDSFIVGADIEAFQRFTTPEEVKGLIRDGHALFNRIEGLKKPVVAAVHGAAVGGGLEIIMACTYRIASEHPKTKFALPEVNLGLLPGLGGTQRLPRLVGLQKGLELILSGKNIYPKPARRMGLIDATIHPQGLLEAAKRAAAGLADGTIKPNRPKTTWRDTLLERTPLNRMVYRETERTVLGRTRGNYPAPLKIIETIRTGLEGGMQKGLEAEVEGFTELVFTPESKALIHLFFAKNASEKNPYPGKAREVKTVGVLGAGLMGSGIAEVSAKGGYDILLKDRDLTAAAGGKKVIYDNLTGSIGKGNSRFERDLIAERVTPLERYEPFAKADLVIEAVFEDINLKRSVLKDVEAQAPEGFIFASNTSSIPIADIVEASRAPENVIGMHYFSPVQKMPLLEIIKTDRTSERALSTAYEVGLAQGKTIITVNDAPGFYTTRILAVFMNEALLLLEEGADIKAVDRAMRDYGFPVGPFTLLDEVGIDVGAKITEVLRPLFSERGITPSEAGKRAVEADYKGRKNKRGFYSYNGKDKRVNPEVYGFFGGKTRKDIPAATIQERLGLMMINEAVFCLQENVLLNPRDGDVGAVFGLGFPPFLGGPFFHIDHVGAKTMQERMKALETQYGSRFKPARLLEEHAQNGTTFY